MFHSVCSQQIDKNPPVGNRIGLAAFLGEGNDNALQYFFLENPMDREAWQAAVHGVVGVGHRLATKTHNVRNGDCVSPFSF